MRTRSRLFLAAAGVAVALAAGIPVALAGTGPTTGTPSPTPAAVEPAAATTCTTPVRDYLAAHPDVARELEALRALPADRRPAARKAWATQHPDLAAGLRDARQQASGALGSRLGAAGDYVAAHPDVQALLDTVEKAPTGQRAEAAQQYLTAHPGVRAELRGLRQAVRQACGGK